MSLTINTNVTSLNAQRNLTTSQDTLKTSLQRLSSGLRINSAKDDAAGLAISERMTSQIRGINQAVRNSNDGVSLAQITEGALGEVSNMLQRIRELAVQSVNATNSSTDRAALDTEAQQLKEEINRIANTTSYNGVKLLDGSFTNKVFQVGANTAETITVENLANVNTASLGAVTATTLYQGAAIAGYASAAPADDGIKDIAINGFAIKGPDISGVFERFNEDTSALERATELVTAINSFTGSTAVRAELNFTNDGVNLFSDTGTDIVISSDAQSASNIKYWFGLDVGSYTSTTNPGGGLDGLSLTTASSSNFAIQAADAALDSVNISRAAIGAIQSRFNSVISNSQITSENLSAARSRILDADFAMETATLSRSQILQQASTAMLAQANLIPQNVLSLLG